MNMNKIEKRRKKKNTNKRQIKRERGKDPVERIKETEGLVKRKQWHLNTNSNIISSVRYHMNARAAVASAAMPI